jgi:drug/metabolite transporter (DMT)-like permease
LIYLYGVFRVHLSYIKSKLFKKFLLLFIILSILSFIYVIRYTSFEKKIEKNRNLFFSGLVCYIFGSCFWSIAAAYIEISKVNSDIQYIPLIITALGSIFILISLQDEKIDLLLAACYILIIQHCIIDLVIWPKIHRKGQRKKELFRLQK